MSKSAPNKPFDPRTGLRSYLALDMVLRAFIWSIAAVVTMAVILWLNLLPTVESWDTLRLGTAWTLVCTGASWLLTFNFIYVAVLILLRLPIPAPREGRYTLKPGQIPDINIISSCLCSILTKARYEAPFPGFLVFNLANLPPLLWLMGPIFGPRSKSAYVVDPKLLDPHLTEIGRNVTIGFGTIIAAHAQERDAIIIKKTIIEDDVLFGGNCIVFAGCHIRRGAVILSGAVLQTNTVVGENELWGGLPAKKIRDLPRYEERPAEQQTAA